MSLLDNVKARRIRRGLAIRCAVGPNGGGKTALCVYDLLPSLERGRKVISTVRLLDYENPRPCDDPTCESPNHHKHMAAHPLYVRWTGWHQLIEAEHCDVFADEVTGVASARDWSNLPGSVVNVLVQLRRRDVTLTWTAPSWAMADSVLKRVSQGATVCTGYLPVDGVDSEGLEREWRNRRLFRWMTYDAALLTDLEAGKRDKLHRLAFALHWGPGSDAFKAYDTFDAVDTVGFVNQSGPCEVCGGRRQARMCSCPDYVRPSRVSRRGAGGGGSRFVDDTDGSSHE